MLLDAAITGARAELAERRAGPSLTYWRALERRLLTWEAMAAELNDADAAPYPLDRDWVTE